MRTGKKGWTGIAIICGVAAVAAPSGVSAYKHWREAVQHAALIKVLQTGDPEMALQESPESLMDGEEEHESGEPGPEPDEPLLRAIALRNLYGDPSAELTARWARLAHEESRKWAHLVPRNQALSPVSGDPSKLAAVNGLSWVSLGPTDANFEFNSFRYTEVDSGRITSIAPHPTNPDIVYVSTAGGGVWKTFDFSAPNPRWYPISENLGNLAVGAIAIDPQQPETLYLGLGDFRYVPGGQILKTADGGASWSTPISLAGVYDPGGVNFAVSALRMRTLVVDPVDSQIVLVGTDIGLFRSTDGGQSFTLVDLPNQGSQVAESVWSIVYTGQVQGVSRWALSGVYAASPGVKPPDPGLGTEANPGDVWISDDAGATWSSRRAAGVLPATVTPGRIDLGAGTPSLDPIPSTVIYAQVAAATERAGAGLWRSDDSGKTFQVVTGTLRNPTTHPDTPLIGCDSVNVNRQQAYYNQAVAVDPADNAHVIVAGAYCGLRTLDGLSAGPTWELVSHWLPASGRGDTADGRLPYVHADWHTLQLTRTASGYQVIAGTDGGLFVSTNVFTPGPITDQSVTWRFPNRGIVSHLFYSVASGDPVTGNAALAYGGTQDNGTRYRDSPALPTTFNQIIGGDGVGAAVAQVPSDTVYWASTQNDPYYCDPDTHDCGQGESWDRYIVRDSGPFACSGDVAPFLTQLVPVRTATDATGPAVLTMTNLAVYRYVGDPSRRAETGREWELLGDASVTNNTGACLSGPVHRMGLAASTTVDGLFGVALSGGRYRVTSNCSLSAPGQGCTWKLSSLLGVDLDNNGSVGLQEQLAFTSSLDFPPGPTGKAPGMVYVVATVAPTTQASTPVPDALGHLFITQDGGDTWQPLHGNGQGFDLPNLPINVIRYDPGDLTNKTLYAGTDLGVYRTTDGGQTWQRFGYGLPLVRVMDLFINQTGSLLRAATFGRGLWEIYPSAEAARGAPGTGDWDRNQQIDFVDLLSTANRLGTTPATAQAPLYDWNQDLTGSQNQIDEADLTQVLSRYGGRP